MSVLVAYANTPEGAAALAHGRRLAASDGREVFVFDLDARSDAADRSIAPTAPPGAGSERWFARAPARTRTPPTSSSNSPVSSAPS